MTRIVLNDEGAAVRAFLQSRGLDFQTFLDTSVSVLAQAVCEYELPGVAGTHCVEVDDGFVVACLDRGMEPGVLLSRFLVECMEALAAEAGVSSVEEGA